MKPVIIAGVCAAALSLVGGAIYTCCSCRAPEEAPATAVAPATEATPAASPAEDEMVEGMPWLKKQPGVTYSRPQKVPEILAKKYQSFDEAWEQAKTGGGEFVATDGESGYQVNWLDPNSGLGKGLGLRPGDKVISINGQSIGESPQAGVKLFEQLKNDGRFVVKIERNGEQMVLTFGTGK